MKFPTDCGAPYQSLAGQLKLLRPFWMSACSAMAWTASLPTCVWLTSAMAAPALSRAPIDDIICIIICIMSMRSSVIF